MKTVNKKQRQHIARMKQFKALNERRIKAIHSLVPHLSDNPIRFHIFQRYGTKRRLEREQRPPKPPKKTHSHRTRVATFSIEQVREWTDNPPIQKRGKAYAKHENIRISLRRMPAIFHMGFQCRHCPEKGVKFCLEKTIGGQYHLDLYSENDVLMTIDHKVPKSKGGEDDLSNYQCLCHICNGKKGNKHCD